MIGWTEDGLVHAWRALAQQAATEEWRFVHLSRMGDVSVEAGCFFPLAREALIVTFPESWPKHADRLPEGKGFDVITLDSSPAWTGRRGIALVRRAAGSPDIFAVMVVDLLRTLGVATVAHGREALRAFLERVREWQRFMSRTHRPLSTERQIGLLGELWVLKLLSETSLAAGALECWHGPLRAAQDFRLPTGAIEVKSTARKKSFLARVNSIEQLEGDGLPTFLCAMRFEETTDGTSLTELVDVLRKRFRSYGVERAFDALLLVMGYFDEHAGHYNRRLTLKTAQAFLADEDLPRLTHASVPKPVRSATYVLDLEALGVQPIDISELFSVLRVATHEP